MPGVGSINYRQHIVGSTRAHDRIVDCFYRIHRSVQLRSECNMHVINLESTRCIFRRYRW